MHDVLRQRLINKIESLPDEQIYQILDYIEFLESKYATAEAVESSGLQKFAEGLEDKLRRKAVSPNTIREAFQLISAADRVLSGVSSAGRQIFSDLNQALEVDEEAARRRVDEGHARSIEADPRKQRNAPGSRPDSGAARGPAGRADPSSDEGAADPDRTGNGAPSGDPRRLDSSGEG